MFMDKRKISLVQIAKSRVGMVDEDYRQMLQSVAGVGSAKDMDKHGFDAVMRRFQDLGFTSDFAKTNLANRHPDMATPAQIAKLRGLWQQFTDGKGTDASLGKWLDGRFRVSALRFLDRDTAHKATGALVKMVKRHSTEAA